MPPKEKLSAKAKAGIRRSKNRRRKYLERIMSGNEAKLPEEMVYGSRKNEPEYTIRDIVRDTDKIENIYKKNKLRRKNLVIFKKRK